MVGSVFTGRVTEEVCMCVCVYVYVCKVSPPAAEELLSLNPGKNYHLPETDCLPWQHTQPVKAATPCCVPAACERRTVQTARVQAD